MATYKAIRLYDNDGAIAVPQDCWPVGSIYISVKNVNPTKYFGGTWAVFGTGRALVAVDANNTNFNSVEKTGGSASHTHTQGATGAATGNTTSTAISIAQMPSHNHGQDGHTHAMNAYQDTIASGGYNNNGNQWGANFIYGGQPSSWGFSNVPTFYTKSATPGIWSTGGGQGHTHGLNSHTHTNPKTASASSLQPYITVYMWKRTA